MSLLLLDGDSWGSSAGCAQRRHRAGRNSGQWICYFPFQTTRHGSKIEGSLGSAFVTANPLRMANSAEPARMSSNRSGCCGSTMSLLLLDGDSWGSSAGCAQRRHRAGRNSGQWICYFPFQTTRHGSKIEGSLGSAFVTANPLRMANSAEPARMSSNRSGCCD